MVAAVINPKTTHQQLRQQIRQQRRALDIHQRTAFNAGIAQAIASHRLFRTAKHIACYLPNDGEVNLTLLIAQAWAMDKTVYLPVLSSIHRNHLHFLPYRPGDTLVPNRFGIPEPIVSSRSIINIKRLDTVFTPLVGFDGYGNRLGMGGGFYDRTFAYLRRRQHWRKPRLIGVAYDLQKVAELTLNPWDVPMNGIATESGVQIFNH